MTKQWHVLIVASDKRNRGCFGQISLNARSLNMQQRARAFVVSARVKGLDTPEHDLCSWNDERPRTPGRGGGNGSITRGTFLQALSRRRLCVCECVSRRVKLEFRVFRVRTIRRWLGEGETHMSNFQATWRGSVTCIKSANHQARLPRSREHAAGRGGGEERGSVMAQEVNRSNVRQNFHANVDARDKKGVPRSLRYRTEKVEKRVSRH